MFSTKTALIVATSAAIALTSFDMRPAQAAPESGPAVVKQGNTDEFSSQRKRRRARGVNPAIPLAAFGALIGTIGAVAAARREREVYYYGGGPYYAQPQYVEPYYVPQYVEPPPTVYYHQPAPVYRHHHAPQVYQRHHAPPPRHFGGGFRGHQGSAPAPSVGSQAAPNDGRL